MLFKYIRFSLNTLSQLTSWWMKPPSWQTMKAFASNFSFLKTSYWIWSNVNNYIQFLRWSDVNNYIFVLDFSNPEAMPSSRMITTSQTKTGWTWIARLKWPSVHMRSLLISPRTLFHLSPLGLWGYTCSPKGCIWVFCYNHWPCWVWETLSLQVSPPRNGAGNYFTNHFNASQSFVFVPLNLSQL